VGSVKCRIVDGVREELLAHGVHFVGSHPMAGTENSGLRSAKRDLYDGAVVFIAERPGDSREALQFVCRFWEDLGMIPHRLTPEPHDMLVARTSHVLHLLSYAAAKAYLVEERAALATGGGFRDFTRIAASSPNMWVEIFQSNRDNVLAALDEFTGEMEDLRAMLVEERWDELWDYLDQARASRRAWYAEWLQRREGLS
jgi:prephenate dehydrogenase